ncbi:hypothetical protein LTR47_007717 [Exophiala xenobiotica]|nr:hypothetical protein LTR47_007717 [Exophiala xenobiotica]KAK5366248.1 hypothetical protein LTR11_008291 [Exophiala xenobiotica]KAK5367359.1 hypothetical protein LTS03_008401 [Exophiala xenobiotica]KAK5443164.1 hypothetical protein LTR18_005842 [Exophiala xenobiotica]KAK5453951.1 hypothetical protein LTR20_010461 [Exophiala xenobiotica]
MKSNLAAAMALAIFTSMAIATTLEPGSDAQPAGDHAFDKRAYFQDSYKIFHRKRNAHACIMSIVFIVLFPLGAISQHLPLKGVRVTSRIHAPIQILGLAMMIGAMGLGIDMAKNDLNYFSSAHGSHVPAHVVIGLLVTSSIIVIQPAMGMLQHRHFKKTGEKSVFAYVHRWTGRVMIVLGWINSGLGFQLVGIPQVVKAHSLVRNFVLMGVLGGLWLLLMGTDGLRSHFLHRNRLSSYRVQWNRGLRLRKDGVADGSVEPSKEEQTNPRI